MCRKLHLTLKKRWFDMIASGEKTEEYREIKPYWNKRLMFHYDTVVFRNGHRKDSPTMEFEYRWMMSGIGNPAWGAPKYNVYIITLGKRIS